MRPDGVDGARCGRCAAERGLVYRRFSIGTRHWMKLAMDRPLAESEFEPVDRQAGRRWPAVNIVRWLKHVHGATANGLFISLCLDQRQ